MSKGTTKTAAPKLRFPEYRKSGKWEESLLGDLADRVTRKNRNLAENRVLTNSAADGVVDQRDFFDKDIANTSNLDGYYVIENGDFVYNPRISNLAPVGPISRNDLGIGVMSPLYTVFRFKSDTTDFFAHYFKSDHWHIYLRSVSNTGARHDRIAITSDVLMGMPIYVPQAKEQKKIADCLSSLDELISAQSDKVDSLKNYKKGLLQQLFPEDGESVPRLRFPEFKDSGEWVEKRLGDVCDRIMDGTHFSPKSKKGSRPYLTSKNIRMGRLDLSTVTYISEEEHREIYARCPVRKFDVLLTKDGANTGNCALNTIDYEFSLLSSVAVLRGNPSQVTQNFLFQSIASERTQSTIIGSMSGQAITRITLEKLNNYRIPVPSVQEQQCIGNCLTSIDELIAAEDDKVDSIKNFKKGLLQQLFPSLVEAEDE